MPPLVRVMEEPGKGFYIKVPGSNGETQTCIIAIDEKNSSITQALIIRIMIAVMANDHDKVFKQELS